MAGANSGSTFRAVSRCPITRDMVVVIQGLVVLFAGALEFMFRPAVARLFAAAGRREAA